MLGLVIGTGLHRSASAHSISKHFFVSVSVNHAKLQIGLSQQLIRHLAWSSAWSSQTKAPASSSPWGWDIWCRWRCMSKFLVLKASSQRLQRQPGKQFIWYSIVRKPDFCLCENKGADQLHSNCEADQCLCFRYTDNTSSLLLKSEISSL